MKRRAVGSGLFAALICATCLISRARADDPITADQATAVATKIEDSMRGGDGSTFAGLVDDSAMVATASQGLTLSPEMRAGFASGATVGNQLGTVLGAAVKQGGTYHFLHLAKAGDVERPLFRLIGADGSVNYHKMTLGRSADGTIKVVDLYIFTSGELISDTLHRELVSLVASQNRNVVQKLIGSDNDYATHLADIDRFQKATVAGDATSALSIYDQLPDSLKHDKMLMILRIKNCAAGDPAAYAAAIDDYEKTFPGDPSLLLMSIDALFLRKDYEGVLKRINALDTRVGGDPYLDFLRASARIEEGRDADAAEYFHSAATREPDLTGAWEACVTETLKGGDNAKVVALLDESEKKGGLRWTKVNSTPAFASFVKSTEYADWVKTHPQAPATPPAP